MEHHIHASQRVYELTAAQEQREREIRRQIAERTALEATAPRPGAPRVGVWHRLLVRTHLTHRPA